jgi:hypothetical protein
VVIMSGSSGTVPVDSTPASESSFEVESFESE